MPKYPSELNQPNSDLEQKEDCVTCIPSRLSLILTTMRSVNKVILVGHLAADPETFQTKTGKTRVTFPIATHREATSDGVKKEVTDYHRVVSWGKLGEICASYLAKGQGVYVEGTILNRAYETNGERKYVTEIRADEVNMLTWKKKGGVSSVSIDPVDPVPSE
jgi:single-strand DNA-binding protein